MLLLPILHRAVSISDSKLQIKNTVSDEKINFIFWPKLDNSEPDLIINFDDIHCVFVEAKLHAGLSGSGEKNQLLRQFKDLNGQNASNKSLLFLTKDRVIPKTVIEDSVNAVNNNRGLSAKDFHQSIYWLSWFDIWKICTDNQNNGNLYQRRIIMDLCEYLERMDLKHFTGFKSRKDVKPVNKFLFYEDRRKP